MSRVEKTSACRPQVDNLFSQESAPDSVDKSLSREYKVIRDRNSGVFHCIELSAFRTTEAKQALFVSVFQTSQGTGKGKAGVD